MAEPLKPNVRKRLLKTPLTHTPAVGESTWTQDGRGYTKNRRGSLVRTPEEAPEGFLEAKRQERLRAARSLG